MTELHSSILFPDIAMTVLNFLHTLFVVIHLKKEDAG